MAYGLKDRDYVGSYQRGFGAGSSQREEEKAAPIRDKLRNLDVLSREQNLKAGAQTMSYNDQIMEAQQHKMQQEKQRAAREDMAKAGQYLMSLPENQRAQAYEKVLDVWESEGKPAAAMRGKPELARFWVGMNSPDEAIRMQNREGIQQGIASGNKNQLKQIEARVNPGRAIERNLAEDIDFDVNSLVKDLEANEARDVINTFKANPQNPKDAQDLAIHYMKQKNKPESSAQKTTETQRKASGFAKRMRNAEEIVQELGGDASSIDRFVTQTLTANWLASPKGQQFWNAASEWARAKLRYESGAVIGKEEAEEEAKTYFPVLGDSTEVVKQKAKLREVAMQGMQDAAGSAYKTEEKPEEKPSNKYNEGDTATGPNGKKLEFRGGKWRSI